MTEPLSSTMKVAGAAALAVTALARTVPSEQCERAGKLLDLLSASPDIGSLLFGEMGPGDLNDMIVMARGILLGRFAGAGR